MVTVDANSLARYELNLTGKDNSWVGDIVTGKLFVRIFVSWQQFPKMSSYSEAILRYTQ